EDFGQIVELDLDLRIAPRDQRPVLAPWADESADDRLQVAAPKDRNLQRRAVTPPDGEGLAPAAHRQSAVPEDLSHPGGGELGFRVAKEDQAPVRREDQAHCVPFGVGRSGWMAGTGFVSVGPSRRSVASDRTLWIIYRVPFFPFFRSDQVPGSFLGRR